MKDRHYAYLATSMDGDGCFAASKTFQKRSNCFQYDLKLEVTSSLRKTTQRLIELFGGIDVKNPIDGVMYWKWVCQVRQNQKSVLEGILPFLVLKARQAKLALEFVNLGHKNVPEERKRIVELIQEYNQNPLMSLDNLPDHPDKTAHAGLAGTIDTEGTLSIVRKGTSTIPYIAVYNDSERILAQVKKNFGGYYELHKPPNHLIWKFKGTNKDRERLLLSVLPYLITKREQALVLLEYSRMFKSQNPIKRAELFRRMYELNHGCTSETNTPDTSSEVKTEPELIGDYESAVGVTQHA